ncbi:retropepsin-like aspartic protease [Thalassomonas sp. M1454]|uniref:retropepsin-like aspartic protease n=1 Tax=Thalassomonas sp. M1454 TaxID=2594477 RepID=UPI00117D5459|nr:retropepsin-like aspartic protease [Thalassomonas sp. M1454]TRX56465.1 TIGR02281 family clan AA aspartic protease [Thalassomonas sp. M1454]
MDNKPFATSTASLNDPLQTRPSISHENIETITNNVIPSVGQSNSHVYTSTTSEYPEPEKSDELNLLIAKAEQFFSAHLFTDAMDYYSQVEEMDELSAKQIKGDWLAAAYQWVNQNQYSLVSNFLSESLNIQPYDHDWLLLKIEWLKKNNKIAEAVEAYQNLIRHAFDLDKEKVWTEQMHIMALQKLLYLKEHKSWSEIINFCALLLSYDANYVPYILAISEAYIYQDDATSAISYLDSIRYDENYQAKIQYLYQLIDAENNIAHAIALTKVNEHFIVDAQINNQHDSALMIDTGASITVISKDYFELLQNHQGYEKARDMVINTAGGDEQAFSIKVDQFSIGGYVLNNFEVVVMELPNFDKADGLLGMNFLKQFKFSIDQNNAHLYLEPHQ